MSKWYGNLTNRLEEGRAVPEIKVGTDITMYLWSDRNCYYVTEVISQKEIKVKRYHVCADHDKEGGMGHQNWVYFKTVSERNAYLKKYHPEIDYPEIDETEEVWAYRYGKWMRKYTLTEENYCTDRELKSLQTKGYYNRFYDLSGNVSFGVRNYYYDWEF